MLNHKSRAFDSKVLFTRDEMDWCLKEIECMELPELKRKIISTYIAIALYCKGPERKVVGSLKHDAMLSQFFKKKGGGMNALEILTSACHRASRKFSKIISTAWA
ncbi:hypothetical protein BLL42_26795 [Pseudomonas frederiksbergensis]|uniref:Uncharacterized protein n=1 Tax=Pseudomonas frederiksbergensis TaxID=104087 RepID=A0A1J0ESJ3_9PSED|nr:hypothetical protein BLL42_00095 [Pseudomonas frederiksbergensis]APC19130.1 hypothetical protein BLL42_26795 [Pseudomonas frederiksbergensis]